MGDKTAGKSLATAETASVPIRLGPVRASSSFPPRASFFPNCKANRLDNTGGFASYSQNSEVPGEGHQRDAPLWFVLLLHLYDVCVGLNVRFPSKKGFVTIRPCPR